MASDTPDSRAVMPLGDGPGWLWSMPFPAVLQDAEGRLVDINDAVVAFTGYPREALIGRDPVDFEPEEDRAMHREARAGMWQRLQEGAEPVLVERRLIDASGAERWYRAAARCVPARRHGARRVMAVVQDRSVEDERDIAQLEMGMLMDTGAIGVATYDPARGWLLPNLPSLPATDGGEGLPQASALMGVSRDRIEPGSLPEYERLQQALRTGERAVVTYAVRHPELGRRWLQTRVEPAVLAGGRSTTSVVTRDVTEQQGAKQRSQQLLHEMTTILDSSPAGMAYLRGPALVRCNRRFERMLGFAPGAAAGASLEEILARSIGPISGVRDALAALAEGRLFEAELPTVPDQGPPRWYSLSVRRAGPAGDQAEAVAVLTDITRLKLQQAELQQSMRERELMFTLSDVGIVYQRGARIERANPAMAALTGWGAPELASLDPAELYESARACVDFEARVARGLAEQGRFSAERLLKRRDGRLLWVQVAVRQVDSDDEEAGVISSFVDIDERRRARETMAAQAERTKAILDSVLVGIVTVGEQGIEWMNRSARRMFAGELADFLHEPAHIVATPEASHPLRRNWLATLEEGTAETFECQLRGRDGRVFWVAGNAVLSRGVNSTREVTFALLDIERRRQAELRIAEAQASLQRVIETAPAAIALVDAATLQVRQANQTASSALGLVEGGGVADPALAQALGTWLAGWCQGAEDMVGPQVHEWRHGEGAAARVWDCRLAPLAEPGEAGASAPGLVLLVASDVTGQRAAEQARLAEAIAQREVLVREVHHRIKNNLQGVAGLLQQTAKKHPPVSQILIEAVGQVQAIAQVYGLQVGAHVPLGLAGLMRAVAASVERMFVRRIAVHVSGDPRHELPEAESIPIALVLNELFTNAIKHGPPADEAATGAEAASAGPAGEAEAPVQLACSLAALPEEPAAVELQVSGPGRLPEGFDLARHRSAVAGLGLVRALLPRRASTFTLEQQGDRVVARIVLRPPAVVLAAAAPAPRSLAAQA
jgi:PAS domain S-box-containing protein